MMMKGEEKDPKNSARSLKILLFLLVGYTFWIYFYCNPRPMFYYDYTFRVAENLFHGALGFHEKPPGWLNEFVPFKEYWYSVFPLGSVLSMLPFAFFKFTGLINEMPASLVTSLQATAIGGFLLLIAGRYKIDWNKRILLVCGVLYGTWMWTNLALAGAWQLALGFAMLGELGAIYFTVFDRRPLVAGFFFALAFGNRTEVILTTPVFVYLLLLETGRRGDAGTGRRGGEERRGEGEKGRRGDGEGKKEGEKGRRGAEERRGEGEKRRRGEEETLRKQGLMTRIWNFVSAIRHPPSAIRHPTSDIENPKSEIRNPKSNIRNPKSNIRNPKSNIRNLLSFCAVPFVLGVATLIYNYLRFESPADFGYARIPGVLSEPWYAHGIFSLRYIPFNFYEMLLKPWNRLDGFPYLIPDGFGSAIWWSSPFLLFVFRSGARDRRLKYAAWTAVGVLTFLLWTHGNPGGWQFGYRYAMTLLPWLFVILLESSPPQIRWYEWPAYLFSIAVNCYACYLFFWTDYIKP